MIYKEGIEKNKKSLETRIDDSGNKWLIISAVILFNWVNQLREDYGR